MSHHSSQHQYLTRPRVTRSVVLTVDSSLESDPASASPIRRTLPHWLPCQPLLFRLSILSTTLYSSVVPVSSPDFVLARSPFLTRRTIDIDIDIQSCSIYRVEFRSNWATNQQNYSADLTRTGWPGPRGETLKYSMLPPSYSSIQSLHTNLVACGGASYLLSSPVSGRLRLSLNGR